MPLRREARAWCTRSWTATGRRCRCEPARVDHQFEPYLPREKRVIELPHIPRLEVVASWKMLFSITAI